MSAAPFAAFALPRLHVLTDDAIVERDDFLATALAICDAIGKRGAFHLRTRQLSGASYFALARSLAECCRSTGTLLVVNDRVDLALASGISGGISAVQLGRASLSVDAVRRLAPEIRIGVSLHDASELNAESRLADWVIAGHVFTTGSHPGEPERGISFLSDLCTHSVAPVIAVGGITPERIEAVLAAGGYGVAVLSGIWGEEAPERAAIRYLSEVWERQWPRER